LFKGRITVMSTIHCATFAVGYRISRKPLARGLVPKDHQ